MNIKNRTDNNETINNNGSTGSIDTGGTVITTKSELNQTSASEFNSYINAQNSTSAFMNNVEGS